MSGKLAQETEVEIEETNRFPIGNNRWEVLITKRRVQYEIRQLTKNEIFGHQELIALLKQEASYEEKTLPGCLVGLQSCTTFCARW